MPHLRVHFPPPAIASRLELTPAIARTREWSIDVGDAPARAVLEYSRFWGNFKKRLSS